jgi:Zn-dependent M28 family amino/carboxypeptidase
VELSVPARAESGVEVQNVIGVWAGEDAALDAEAIVVAAYYDGLGRFPDGTLYPGANDNASGVAAMLEMVRTLKEQGFRPKRTIMFVAWIGGERHRMVDYPFYLKAHPYFADAYKIVAGLELEGVGAGTGSSAVIWNTTRERLTEVVQQAARRVRTPLTTREQGLHADRSLWPYASATVPSATISWSGSDDLAHTPQDTLAHLDPGKLGQVGRMVSLAVMVLANDPAY